MAVPRREAILTLPREPYFFPSPWPSARALTRSPWKVALIASSSWSHSFLTEKHGQMYPDVEADRHYFEALRAGDWDTWRHTHLAQAEDRGHHELLNWFCLAGAMAELKRKPDEAEFLESWITHSDKVFAVFVHRRLENRLQGTP